jgi:hypothetical protein
VKLFGLGLDNGIHGLGSKSDILISIHGNPAIDQEFKNLLFDVKLSVYEEYLFKNLDSIPLLEWQLLLVSHAIKMNLIDFHQGYLKNDGFLDRFFRAILSSRSNEFSSKAYKTIKSMLCQIENQWKLQLLTYLFSIPVISLQVASIDLLKECLHQESLLETTPYFNSGSLLYTTFFPIIFSLSSKFYGSASIYHDPHAFIEKLDLLIQIVNLIKYLCLRDKNSNNPIMIEEEMSKIETSFIKPVSDLAQRITRRLENGSDIYDEIVSEAGLEYLESLRFNITILSESIISLK